jgi:hypothetical protein
VQRGPFYIWVGRVGASWLGCSVVALLGAPPDVRRPREFGGAGSHGPHPYQHVHNICAMDWGPRPRPRPSPPTLPPTASGVGLGSEPGSQLSGSILIAGTTRKSWKVASSARILQLAIKGGVRTGLQRRVGPMHSNETTTYVIKTVFTPAEFRLRPCLARIGRGSFTTASSKLGGPGASPAGTICVWRFWGKNRSDCVLVLA